jgi:hypothetical protein
MILHCPFCRRQHVDAPSEAEGWTNPPHKSHLCSGCGCIWRPADVPTVGVERIATRGQRDTRPLTAADEAATPLLCDALAPGPMNSTRYQCVYDRGHKRSHRYLRADFFRPPLTAAQIEAAAAYPYAHASRGMDMDMTLTPPVGNCKACGKRYPTVAEVREHRWGGLEGVCSARSPACAAALAKAWRAMKEQSSELSAEAAPTGEPTDPPIGRSADDARMALRRHVALRLQAEAGLTKERDDLKREETGNRDFTAGMEMVVAQIKGWQVGITDEAKDKLVALVKGMAYGDVKGWETMEEKVARLTRELGWREEDVRRFTKMHDAELKRADALEHRERLAIEQAAKLVNLPDDYLRRDMDEEHTAAHHPETVRALADGLLHARAELAAFEAGVRGDSDHYDRDDQAQAAAFLRGGNAVAGLRTELAAVRATLAEVREHAMSWFIAENAAGQPLYRDGKALYDLAYECFEVGQHGVAATLLAKTYRLSPGSARIMTELVSNLDEMGRHGDACRVLRESGLVEKDYYCRYLLAFHLVMAGDLAAAEKVPLVLSEAPENLRWPTEQVRHMLDRARAVKGIAPLDEWDLRGWHYVINGGLLLHLSSRQSS